jgi:Zinc carboxypeptidase
MATADEVKYAGTPSLTLHADLWTNPMRLLRFTPLVMLCVARFAVAADMPNPPQPSDYSLVKWAEVSSYLAKLDAASDRVVVRELGKTTEGRPYFAAFVSSPETIHDLDRYKAMQRRIALAEGEDVADLVPKSKAVVIITCSIHSSETASTFMAMKLLHDLATGNDPDTKEVLDKTIVIVVPSANPDGVDIVAEWYDRTKGKPWEGGGQTKLYHKYAGHDTNRDWFMLNLKETQLLTHLLYKEWFPTLAYDVHQMGSRGARMFVPPFYDPINPNLDPRIHQSIATIGAHMASDLAAKDKKGVLTHAMYDNWWNGGNRTTPQRHNIVAVLTEAASAKLATPIFLDKDQLRASSRGMTDHRQAVNFVDPWAGGWWHQSDIEEYERICARSLLTLAARYKDRFQGDYLAMAKAAIAKGKSEPPYGWVVPMDGRDPGTAAEMVRILQETGIRVHRTRTEMRDGGATYPAGSYVLLADQPYRAHLKDMMERQEYPARFTANGEAEAPYDVAGWTLPLQMGVRSVALNNPASSGLEEVAKVEEPAGQILGESGNAQTYSLDNVANDDFVLLNELLAAGVEVRRVGDAPHAREWGGKPGSLVFRAGAKTVDVLKRTLPTISSKVTARLKPISDEVMAADTAAVARSRIGVYQPWVPSMDEGWTRLVLEEFHFAYETIHNGDVRAGNLISRIDTLLIPSIDAATIRDGYEADQTEPQYVGGLGREGAAALRGFLHDGGTIVCLEDSCTYAIEDFGLGVTNVTKGLKTSEFYGPGSVVGIVNSVPTSENPLSVGMPAESSAYFDRSMAFDFAKGTNPAVVSRYAERDTLQSGWLLGASKIAGKAAVATLPMDRGHVVLFGFPPQHRGQPHGTFRLLFNALYR